MQFKIQQFSFIPLIILLIILSSCKHNEPVFETRAFDPMANYPGPDSGKVVLKVFAGDTIFEGVSIPEVGKFKLQFQIKNLSGKAQSYYYKIFYRNESYKFAETLPLKNDSLYNPQAGENFYGSWMHANDGFHKTELLPDDGEFHTITDEFLIQGNPRDEHIYFGQTASQQYKGLKKLHAIMDTIRAEKNWLTAVTKKANEESRSVDDQIYLDAMWILHDEANRGDANNRWKRNPRAGQYSFTLLVVSEDELPQIPKNLVDLSSMEDSRFIDPYFTLFHDPSFSKNKTAVLLSPRHLLVKIGFDLSKGIYIDPIKSKNQQLDTSFFNGACNQSRAIFLNAQIQQFFHSVDKTQLLKTVPEIRDIDNFTQDDYQALVEKYTDADLVSDYIHISPYPCSTVAYEADENAIVLKNPASTPHNKFKENVGIQSRVGFTYGKITAKIKFPSLLNKAGVWNGLTNAFWLINQDLGNWDLRRPCDSLGYIPKSEMGKTEKRVRQSFYSEIDIEIVKTSKNWPPSSYTNEVPFPENNVDNDRDIILASTNWDLACNDPKKFNVGVNKIEHQGTTYYPHRWDYWYKALTEKYATNNDALFHSDFYYYQIDWQPDRIIWRIGPDKQHMKEFAYMDASISSIPNNQMVFIVSQEYHHSNWWPMAPFKQDYIPYSAKAFIGKVYEVEIE